MKKSSLLVLAALIQLSVASNILMITMGGTKSHKIPFWELARGLIPRGHNVTFVSGFPADFHLPGLDEISPAGLVFYIKNYTNWDLLGPRMRGEEPISVYDVVRYGYESCDAFLSDPEIKDLMKTKQTYDLFILDGAFPECALGIANHFKVPYIFINTVGFFTGSLSLAGNPVPYSYTPFLGRGFTDNMSLPSRFLNTVYHLFLNTLHQVSMDYLVQPVMESHLGEDLPRALDLTKNVSFILQNAHATVTYPRPYLPNVAEIACIHCRPAKPLPKDLEDFINEGGDIGFIYISMGSSVKADNMPEYLRLLFLRVFEQLPYRVLWKWESAMPDLPENVMVSRWLPQQDLLGHRKIRGFITHGGLLSMFETVYHGVPVVTMPVFCDHDANAAKAELDGYALKLELQSITSESLMASINKIIHDPKYRREVKKRQMLLKDQKETPLDRAVYWTEYVIRHKGAYHLQSPAKDLGFVQYYLIDVAAIMFVCLLFVLINMYFAFKLIYHWLTGNIYVNFYIFKNKDKVE